MSDGARFDKLRRTWEVLGEEDPLWAVASLDEKRGNRWDPEEFFRTGEADVERMLALLRRCDGFHEPLGAVLDFGCGVGRLTRAWSARAGRVVGVDISAPMIGRGRELLSDRSNVELRVNARPDLRELGELRFDCVATLICLQHMPWELAQGYLREFGRVLADGGFLVFQLPARPAIAVRAARVRKWLVDRLPLGMAAAYRRWRHGSSEVFDMHYTPVDEVRRAVEAAGLTWVLAEPDLSCAAMMESYFYVGRKDARAR